MSDPAGPSDPTGWAPPPVVGPGDGPPAWGPTPPGPPPPGAPPAYGPPGWGTGPYGPAYPPAPIDHPSGTLVLVLGLLGIVFCQVLGPVALVMGRNALREIDARPPGTYANRGIVQAGWICGIVGTVLLALTIAGVVLAFALFAVAGTTSGTG